MKLSSSVVLRITTILAPVALVAACGEQALSETERSTRAWFPAEIELAQVSAPVSLRRDPYGIVHIDAQSEDDLFFAQGFNVARDRLWQIDFWRRTGRGELSDVFGPAFIEHDRAARLLSYHGSPEQDWPEYGEDAERISERFVQGINAYVDWLRDNPDHMPVEFEELGYEPSQWSTDDLIKIRGHGVWQNVYSEVVRSIMACNGLLNADRVRSVLEPHIDLTLPERIDVCDVPETVLDLYELGSYPPKLGQKPSGGSNNWAIAGSNTASGRPILASDPHRAFTIPSLRYGVHLTAPGIDVIGAGEPHAPGVALGHNGHVAFGFTIFPADQEDLVILELNPDNPGQYRSDNAWQQIETQSIEISVRGQSAEVRELNFVNGDPVIYIDEEAGRAFALRSVAFKPGGAPYFGQLSTMRSETAEDYDEALAAWGSPGEHHVFADQTTIAWRSAAKVPVRRAHNGLFPVSADSEYEWSGYRSVDELPNGSNPAKGWIATANNIQIVDDYPYAEQNLSYEWVSDLRARRIAEVLNASDQQTISDSVALQDDHVSILARDLVSIIEPLSFEKSGAQKAQARLVEWDKSISAGSVEAALYQIWYYGQLDPKLIELAGASEFKDAILLADDRFILDALASPSVDLWGGNPLQARDQFLEDTLARANRDFGLLFFGTKREERTWGSLLTARWKHIADERMSKPLRKMFALEPVSRGGDLTTPGFALFNEDFDLLYGASWKMVIDVGAWDNSVFVNAPGQSGDPSSVHFDGHYQPWANNEMLPLLYSEEALNAVELEIVNLVPLGDQ